MLVFHGMWLAGLVAAGGAWPWGAVPHGTDLLARIELHDLVEPVSAAWWQGRPLLAAHPFAAPLDDFVEARWAEPWRRVQKATGADFSTPGCVATVAVDLDARAGPVLGVTARNCFAPDAAAERAPPNDDERLSSFVVEDRPAVYDRQARVGWVRLDAQTLVVGTRRGVRRSVRALLGRRTEDDGQRDARSAWAEERLKAVAGSLHEPAPILLATVLPQASQGPLPMRREPSGPLQGSLEPIESLAVAAWPARLRAVVGVRRPEERDRTVDVVRGATALLRGGAGLLEGGGELLLALGHRGQLKRLLPGRIYDEDVESVVRGWLRGFALGSTVRPRGARRVEVILEPSNYRGLALAALFWLVSLAAEDGVGSEAEIGLALQALRVAEQAHRARTGRYLECGPTPHAVPRVAVPWPDDGCFSRLGFRPRAPVRFQLETTVTEGRLMVVGRGDPDGDGVPDVWFLNETDGEATSVRTLARDAGRKEPGKGSGRTRR